MQRLRIDHTTEYSFPSASTLLPHKLLLRPRSSHTVRIESSTLEIEPAATVKWQSDALDNSVAIASFEPAPTQRLRIASSVVIEHYEEAPLDFIVEEHAVRLPFSYLQQEAVTLAPFLQRSFPDDGAVERWITGLGLRETSIETYGALDRMTRAIHDAFKYQAREEPGVQLPAYTLQQGTGSCRDFATLLMEACRSLGIATRFVSGYLQVPAETAGDGATHAWIQAYLPGPGWKGFDPTTGELASTSHIPVAVAHHPEHVPPVAGSFVGPVSPQPTMRVQVRVETLDPKAPA